MRHVSCSNYFIFSLISHAVFCRPTVFTCPPSHVKQTCFSVFLYFFHGGGLCTYSAAVHPRMCCVFLCKTRIPSRTLGNSGEAVSLGSAFREGKDSNYSTPLLRMLAGGLRRGGEGLGEKGRKTRRDSREPRCCYSSACSCNMSACAHDMSAVLPRSMRRLVYCARVLLGAVNRDNGVGCTPLGGLP